MPAYASRDNMDPPWPEPVILPDDLEPSPKRRKMSAQSAAEELLAQFSPKMQTPKREGLIPATAETCHIIMTPPKRARKKSGAGSASSVTPSSSPQLPRRPSSTGAFHAVDGINSSLPESRPRLPLSEGQSKVIVDGPLGKADGASPSEPLTADNAPTTVQAVHGEQRTSWQQFPRSSPDPLSLFEDQRKATVEDEPPEENMEVKQTSRIDFLLSKKELLLPLLPPQNTLTKWEALRNAASSPSDNMPLTTDYQELSQQPRQLQGTMKPYQLRGLSFLLHLYRNDISGILGDEMGLGKTLQTLSLLQYLQENSNPDEKRRPHLVICPLSVLSSWVRESARWTPDLNIIRFHGSTNERNRLKSLLMHRINPHLAHRKKKLKPGEVLVEADPPPPTPEERVDLVITTYETYRSERKWFGRFFHWDCVILDEGHKIKNESSGVSMSLQTIRGKHRLVLTGTPLQNDLNELWALFHWLFPEVFNAKSAETFKQAFDLSHGKVDTAFLDHARRFLEIIMLRRMKASPGVDLNLPPKTEVLLNLPLTPLQREWYERILTGVSSELLQDILVRPVLESTVPAPPILPVANGKSGKSKAPPPPKNWQTLMNLLQQLRKCCNHPYTFRPAMPDDYHPNEDLLRGSSKFIVLKQILEQRVIRERRKILVFSGFTRMLDFCSDLLDLVGENGRHFRYLRLDGSTCRARRNLDMRIFNDPESDCRIMLISTRAGGLGINLTAATDVVLMDQDWNPQITLQAEARAHRIGQTQPVTIYKLSTLGTVEEQMLSRIRKKLYLSTKITESMRDLHGAPILMAEDAEDAEEERPQLATGELINLLRQGTRAFARPDAKLEEMCAWDWETMLEKCSEKPSDNDQMLDGATPKPSEDDEAEWLRQVEQVKTRHFAGRKISRIQSSEALILPDDTSREDRRKGKNTTVKIGGFHVSKESLLCKDWEAAPTMAGKDPRLAEPAGRKRPQINHQTHCQVCYEDDSLIGCRWCPRSFHLECMSPIFQTKAFTPMFACPQHSCVICGNNTNDAGGMLLRCRWCDRSFCDDCLDFPNCKLVGDVLPEYEVLGFAPTPTAYFIQCAHCVDHHARSPARGALFRKLAVKYRQQHRRQLALEAEASHGHGQPLGGVGGDAAFARASPGVSLTDGTTRESSGLATPVA